MLADYLRHHITEETGEDEWLLQDLEAVGRDRAAVLAEPPSPVVAGLVGAQYYWVFHYDPIAFLGYLAALEGYPPSQALIDELMARTGYDEGAFRTILAHAERDPGHRDELLELLDRLPGITRAVGPPRAQRPLERPHAGASDLRRHRGDLEARRRALDAPSREVDIRYFR